MLKYIQSMLIGRYLFQHEKNTYITVKKVFFSYGGGFIFQLCVGVGVFNIC